MRTLWKVLARLYLAAAVEEWFQQEGPGLEARMRGLGLSPQTALLAVKLFREWLLERAGKV